MKRITEQIYKHTYQLNSSIQKIIIHNMLYNTKMSGQSHQQKPEESEVKGTA